MSGFIYGLFVGLLCGGYLVGIIVSEYYERKLEARD